MISFKRLSESASRCGDGPGIHMFLRERISRYSSEVSGAAKIGLETAHYARTRRYAARWSRWKTVGQFSASASATRRIAFFQEAEQNLYSTTVMCYRDRRRTCNRNYARHTWRQDTASNVTVCTGLEKTHRTSTSGIQCHNSILQNRKILRVLFKISLLSSF